MLLVSVLFFLSLFIYSSLVFGAPTAPRAFEPLTRFKRSQFGTDLRQCSCRSDFLSFFITVFIPFYFAINLNGEMMIGQNESHDYSAEVVENGNELSISETK